MCYLIKLPDDGALYANACSQWAYQIAKNQTILPVQFGWGVHHAQEVIEERRRIGTLLQVVSRLWLARSALVIFAEKHH